MADPPKPSGASSSHESKKSAKWDSAYEREDLANAQPVNNPITPAPEVSEDGPLTPEEAWKAMGRLPAKIFNDGDGEAQARWRRSMVPKIAALVARIDASSGDDDPTGATTPNLEGRQAFFDHFSATSPGDEILWLQTLATYFAEYPDAMPARERRSFDAKCTASASAEGQVKAAKLQGEYLRGWNWSRATKAPAATPCDCVEPRQLRPSEFAERICGCHESQSPKSLSLRTVSNAVRSLPRQVLTCISKCGEKTQQRFSRAG